MKVLFICTGNTCRSPMAEHLVRNNSENIEVKSAGIFAMGNKQANDHAIAVMKEKDIDLDHRSQPVTQKLLAWADLVLTMTIQHKQSLIMQFPHYQEKYFTLKEYVSNADNKVWSELKKSYEEYEQKRAQFIRENEHLYDNNHLNKLIMEKFQPEIDNIQRLEASIVNGDISDPFGGDLAVYKKTLAELEQYTSQLILKLEK